MVAPLPMSSSTNAALRPVPSSAAKCHHQPAPSPMLLSIDRPVQNGFSCRHTTTTVLSNSCGLHALGPEQKSHSLSNLEMRQQQQATAAATNAQLRCLSPTPSSPGRATSNNGNGNGNGRMPVPRLQRQHWKYGLAFSGEFGEETARFPGWTEKKFVKVRSHYPI